VIPPLTAWLGARLNGFSVQQNPRTEKRIQLALFLASERSNHISGRLIHVSDDWKRLEHDNMKPELYTLRRVMKI
jgi:hypothetical protein